METMGDIGHSVVLGVHRLKKKKKSRSGQKSLRGMVVVLQNLVLL